MSSIEDYVSTLVVKPGEFVVITLKERVDEATFGEWVARLTAMESLHGRAVLCEYADAELMRQPPEGSCKSCPNRDPRVARE